MGKTKTEPPIFHVERWVEVLGDLIYNNPDFWVRLGNFESKVLTEEIRRVRIEKPIYVTGLARSGSTLLLEILASHRGVVSQQYKDFPPVYTPFWWNWLLGWIQAKNVQPTERAHRDGMLITPESPEAIEEIIWMTFFPNAHNPEVSNILDQGTSFVKFENFYKNHLRKLLLVRKGNRYLAKGNYNITRLEYILTLFPDARFVIPVRQPTTHIASLMKQHLLFCRGEKENPKAIKHLQRVGHFEFGLDLRPINTGDTLATEELIRLWQNQQDVLAWSRYWSQIHYYIIGRLNANPRLREASMIVRFEDLCESPEETLKAIMNHCRLEDSDKIIGEFADKIRFPGYYKLNFSAEDLEMIQNETQAIATQLGY